MEFSQRFSDSYVALIAMLWAELDDLLRDLRSAARDAPAPVQLRAEALLLELVLLRECAAREPLRAATAPSEHAAYCSLIDDVWRLLDFEPTALPSPCAEVSVQHAQDRLLLEVERIALVRGSGTANVRDGGSIRSH